MTQEQADMFMVGNYAHSYNAERPSTTGGFGSNYYGGVPATDCPTQINRFEDYRTGASKLEAVLKLRVAFDKECVQGHSGYPVLGSETTRFKMWYDRVVPFMREKEGASEWISFDKKREERERGWKRDGRSHPPEAEGDPWTVRLEDANHRSIEGCVLETPSDNNDNIKEDNSRNNDQQQQHAGRDALVAAFPWAEPVWFGEEDQINRHDDHGDRFQYLNPTNGETVFCYGASSLVLESAAKLLPSANLERKEWRKRAKQDNYDQSYDDYGSSQGNNEYYQDDGLGGLMIDDIDDFVPVPTGGEEEDVGDLFYDY